jgi:hypothetical protein
MHVAERLGDRATGGTGSTSTSLNVPRCIIPCQGCSWGQQSQEGWSTEVREKVLHTAVLSNAGSLQWSWKLLAVAHTWLCLKKSHTDLVP